MVELMKLYDQYKEKIRGDTFDFDKFNQYAIVHQSNAIEGSTLTKEETFLLLDEKLTPDCKPLEHSLMAVDHLEALKLIIQIADRKESLSVDIVKKISSLIMKSTGSVISSIAGDFDSSKGDFRKVTVRAGTSTFMDYKKVPERVNELVNYINKDISNVKGFLGVNKLAFDLHFQMVSIHPFADGNGRLSRLLMNYVQRYHKMPLTTIYKEDRTKYFKSLHNAREKEDINIFRAFMFEQTKKHLKNKIEELSVEQNLKKSNGKGTSFLF